MEICVRSAYNYLVCESRFDTKELLQAIQKNFDIDFGSTYGFSSKKGEWERVVITEEDIINCLSGNDEYDKGIYYYYTDNDKQYWDETALFAEISDCIYEYCSDKEEIIEWGDLVSRRVFVQDNLVHEDF